MLPHHVKQRQGARDIVVVIRPWLCHGLPHRLEPGEVDAAVEGAALVKDPAEALPVTDVRLIKGDGHVLPRLVPEDLRHALQRDGAAVGEVVGHDDAVAGLDQLDDGVGADEARAAGDKNMHGQFSSCPSSTASM